jgi:hypothetical protein
MSLLENTKSLLEKHLAKGLSLRAIATESDGSVDYQWLAKFSNAPSEHASVTRVQKLHDFLKSLRLSRKRAA